MREILFKAKRRDNGEWVEGYYCKVEKMDKSGVEHYIIEYSASGGQYLIDKNTVCQYAGKRDKNKKEIYNNDILKDEKGNIYRVYWNEYYCDLNCICENATSRLLQGASWSLWSLLKNHFLEVIGNIFDNPELLNNTDKQAGEYADNEVLKSAT